MVSCGFDAGRFDKLGGLYLSPKGYAYMTSKLKLLCKKLVFALEGGYTLKTIMECSESVIRVLLG